MFRIIILFLSIVAAQPYSGRVTDQLGDPVSFASVEVVDLNTGTLSDQDGYFYFDLKSSKSYTFKVSHIGYYDKFIDVEYNNIGLIITLEKKVDPLNQLVVTGERRETYVKDSPVITRVINSQDIENSSCTSVKDLLELAIPNVQNVMSSHAGISNDNVKIQGLDNRYMLFLVDGARVSGEFAGNLDFNMLNLSNVERIEVIEGGMSSLYGSSAIGGVVNIITKKPEKPYEFDFSYFHDDPMVVAKSINMGFNYKKMSYMLNLSNQSSDGYDLTPHDQTYSYPLKTLEKYDSYTLNHNFKFHITDYLYFILNYKKYKNKIYQYQNHFVQVTDDGNELYPFYYYSSLRNNLPWFEDDEYKFDLTYIKKRSTLNFKYQIDRYKKSNYFYNYTNLDCDSSDENYFCQNHDNLVGAEFVNAENYNQNLFIKYDFSWDDKNYFTMGYESNKNEYSSYNIYSYLGDINNDGQCSEAFFPWDPIDCLVESIFGAIDGIKRYDKKAFFVGGQLSFMDNNILSLSIRDVSSKNYGDDMVYSAAYMLQGDLYSYRANYSKGFRVPSIKELYYDFQSHPPPILGNPNLKSTTNNYYSLSVEKRTGNMNSSIEIYYNDVIDMIGTNYVDSDNDGQDDIIMYNNFSQVDITGFNFHYELYSNKNEIKVVYNFTEPISEDQSALELISKHSLRFRYSRQIIEDKLKLFFNAKYAGEKFIMYGADRLYLDDYFISDLTMSLNINQFLSLNFGCKNIFNYIDERRFLEDDYLKNILSSYDPGRRLFLNLKINL